MHSVLPRGVCLIGLLALSVPAKADSQYLQYDFWFSRAEAGAPSYYQGTAIIRAFAFSLLTPAAFGNGSLLSPDFGITGLLIDDQGNPIAGTEWTALFGDGIATQIPGDALPSSLPSGVSPGTGCFEFPVVPANPSGPGMGGYDNNCNLPGHANYNALVRATFSALPQAPGTYYGSSTFVWELLTGWGEGGSVGFGPMGEVTLVIFEQTPEPASLVLLLTIAGFAGFQCRKKFRH